MILQNTKNLFLLFLLKLQERDIYFIRHGESISNTRENTQMKLPDNAVSLTTKGEEQANNAGLFLSDYLKHCSISTKNAILWVSPYKRTRQTAEIINEHLQIRENRIFENPNLVEHNYGLFADKDIEEIAIMFPEEWELYNRYCKEQGKFFVKFPQGESPHDVYNRMELFIGTMFRDYYNPTFIVTHGNVIKTGIMAMMHRSPEWFDAEPTMQNCSIRRLTHTKKLTTDTYIHGGPILKMKKEENKYGH